MAKYKFSVGLPDLPNGLQEKETVLLTPLYRAFSNLGQSLSKFLGLIEYDQSELERYSRTARLNLSRLEVITIQCDEALDYGEVINLFIDSGELKGRKADASAGRIAHAINNNPGTSADNSYIQVPLQGFSAGIGGTGGGTIYYLSTTPGTVTNTPPAGSGDVIQAVGFGLGSLGFYFSPSFQVSVVP